MSDVSRLCTGSPPAPSPSFSHFSHLSPFSPKLSCEVVGVVADSGVAVDITAVTPDASVAVLMVAGVVLLDTSVVLPAASV